MRQRILGLGMIVGFVAIGLGCSSDDKQLGQGTGGTGNAAGTGATGGSGASGGSGGSAGVDCATLGGSCVAVSACSPGQGHLAPGSCSSADSACCLPESACPTEDFYCCSDTAQFRPSCENGVLTCDAPLTKCQTDGGTGGAGGGSNGCVQSGGTVTTTACCAGSADFPNTCAVGACGCSPQNSQDVQTCQCPSGKCFDGTQCVDQGLGGAGGQGGAGGSGGAAGSGGSAGSGGLAAACTNAGGTVTSGLCCASASDFPNMCALGSCSCSPQNSKTVQECQCPSGMCWNGSTCQQN